MTIPAMGSSSAAAQWSPAQIARIESEWRHLRRSFAFHPFVQVEAVSGDPPSEFRIVYRLRTLELDSTNRLAYVEQCSVQLSLPPHFPHAAPVLRAQSRLFHPNVAGETIVLTPPWNPATGSLAEVVARCGALLAYQVLDPAAVMNPAAMQWATQYPHLMPTDPIAVLSSEAGGGPLDRIMRAGKSALDAHHIRLNAASTAILEGAPSSSSAQLRQLGTQISSELGLFFDADIPQELRDLAAELDAWARSMTLEKPVWESLRDFYAHVRAAGTAAEALGMSQRAIAEAMRAAEQLVQNPPSKDPLQTIAQLPVVTALDAAVIRLRNAVRDAERFAKRVRAEMEALSGGPLASAGTPGGLLHARTGDDAIRGVLDATAAREAAGAALAAIEPALPGARAELAALDSVVAWAGFTDLMRRGNELAQRHIELGAAGIQAYFIQTSAGRSGPYQFEERIELGSTIVAVRRIGAGHLEVYDARSMALLGHGADDVQVRLPFENGSTFDVHFKPTEHTDELRLQLDYLIKTVRAQLALLGKRIDTRSSSWPARYAEALARPEAAQAVATVYGRASQRWMTLSADLEALSHFKERLATHFLLERHMEFVPALFSAAKKAEKAMTETNERLAFIASRSSRDLGTEEWIVPPQFASENVECLSRRAKAEKDAAKVRKLLSLVIAELPTRLESKRQLGPSGVPTLRLLRLDPTSAATWAEMLTNERIHARVQELNQLLATKLLTMPA